MKRNLEQFHAGLARGLAPLYLISSDEPLQAQEAADALRARARAAGFAERIILDAELGIDWAQLRGQADSLSLFAAKKIIEVRLGARKTGTEGAQALADYAQRPAEDVLLIISCGKLDRDTQRSAWIKACENSGVCVQIWAPRPSELPAWLRARLQSRGITATAAVIDLLAERTEGNLLAAAQEIDKLALLLDTPASGCVLDAATVVANVGDSARFDLYGVADCALRGDAQRAVKMLDGLRDAGAEPVLVCWHLAREVRAVNLLARGQDPERSMPPPPYRLTPERSQPLQRAAQRLGRTKLTALLKSAYHADRVVKGQAEGNAWDVLAALCLQLAGVPLAACASSP